MFRSFLYLYVTTKYIKRQPFLIKNYKITINSKKWRENAISCLIAEERIANDKVCISRTLTLTTNNNVLASDVSFSFNSPLIRRVEVLQVLRI